VPAVDPKRLVELLDRGRVSTRVRERVVFSSLGGAAQSAAGSFPQLIDAGHEVIGTHNSPDASSSAEGSRVSRNSSMRLVPLAA
jgi:hypothetical protein